MITSHIIVYKVFLPVCVCARALDWNGNDVHQSIFLVMMLVVVLFSQAVSE